MRRSHSGHDTEHARYVADQLGALSGSKIVVASSLTAGRRKIDGPRLCGAERAAGRVESMPQPRRRCRRSYLSAGELRARQLP